MNWRNNMAMKALAFMAAVAAFTAAAIMGWYQLANFDALWTDAYYDSAGYAGGYTRTYLVKQDYFMVRELVDLKDRQAAGQELDLWDKRALERYEMKLDAGATNLRWQLLDKDGGIIYGNTREDSTQADINYGVEYRRGVNDVQNVNAGWEYCEPDSFQGAVKTESYADAPRYSQSLNDNGDHAAIPYYNNGWRTALPELAQKARDNPGAESYRTDDGFAAAASRPLADEDGLTKVLRVVDAGGNVHVFYPTIRACLEANEFGYIFDPDYLTWNLTPEAQAEAEETDSNLILWVDKALRVDDQYKRSADKLAEWQTARERNLAVTIVLGVAGILLMVYLCCAAGHKRGVEGVYLNWFHRVPGDVLLCLLFLGGVASVGVGMELTLNAYGNAPMYFQLIIVGIAMACCAALGMAALVTVCARSKAHTLLRNTWTWRFCAWCWEVFVKLWGWCWELVGTAARAVRASPLIWKAVVVCMAYPIFTLATIRWAGGLWLLVSFLCGLYLCAWAYQWKRIRRGTQEIIGGNPSYHIDTRRMLPDLKGHADELNNLGHAISTAVDERMKSEHFKAELITNVSHDLKTPLTSIINYVDLLKKEDIDNPKAAEYIEVLDRKSQRLKKLTEDLVEASKASTGNLTVNWERLDWAQLTDQALAETGERLEAQKLTVVRSLPGEPVWVEADGRHLWRVLDNLLTNCAKYALPGTRVYIDLRRSGDWAVLSVKNISREALDIPAERLMERFVRGDESRNQAGSGLGLSIAQSLTELQHGRFEISIDGDLFKAIVSLPLAGSGLEDPIQLIL